MKVLMTLGGIPHYIVPLIEAIQRKGVELTLVVPERNSQVIGKGVKLEERQFSFPVMYTTETLAWYQKQQFPKLAESIDQVKPDLVLLGYPYFLQMVFDHRLKAAMKRNRVKLMIREIPFQVPPFGQLLSFYRKSPLFDEAMQIQSKGVSFYLKNLLLMYARKVAYRQATAAINYCSLAKTLLPTYGVRPEQIFVTYNATDAASLWAEEQRVRSAEAILPKCDRRLIHIGRLVKWKRVDLLIDAFQSLVADYEDAELLIVGDGPELDNLKAQAAKTGLGAHIHFVGAVHDSFALGQYMATSSVYVLAGMGGLSINDAMTYGLPVVCSVCDGTEKDLVRHGTTGYLFEEGSVDSLVESLKLLLDSPQEARRLGENGRKVIENEINIDTVSSRFVEAFCYAASRVVR